MTATQNNILFSEYNTPNQTPPFSQIKTDLFIPAMKHVQDEWRSEVKALIQKFNENKASFNPRELIAFSEKFGRKQEKIYGPFYSMMSTMISPEIEKLAPEVSALSSEYQMEELTHKEYFQILDHSYKKSSEYDLNEEELRWLKVKWNNFVRNGALLEGELQTELKEINKELSQLTVKFSQNVTNATKEYFMEITDENDLKGLSSDVVASAKALAKSKDKPEAWLFNFMMPSFIPFMKSAESRAKREELYTARAVSCIDGEFDNTQNILRINELRKKRALLLGYKTHAEYVLEDRMAEKPKTVWNFLDKLKEAYLPQAKVEMEHLKTLFLEDHPGQEFSAWDLNYYKQKLMEKNFKFDEEKLRQYFPLNHVLTGMYQHAEKLFDIKLTKNNDVEKYEDDVEVFDVVTKDGENVGLLFFDAYARETKRTGAWCSRFRGQSKVDGENIRPHTIICCNYAKPVGDKPTLLGVNQVVTLFHEFGHALHSLLTQCQHLELSGTSVLWDFVELPSQLMENWVFEKETLAMISSHVDTAETLPEKYVDIVIKQQQFLAATNGMRQLKFATLDMSWHDDHNSKNMSVLDYEKSIFKDLTLYHEPEKACVSSKFQHIFAGGYSAGYYSYKWAEVLEADVFSEFKKRGIYNNDFSKKYKQTILEKGNTAHPSDLFKQLMGREPDSDALLRREGVLSS